MEKIADSGVLNLLQITDSHLTKDAKSDLLGVVTRDSLGAVLALLKKNMLGKEHCEPDFLVASGDIAQDSSPEAYQYFRDITETLCAHSGWFSGNHDDSQVMTGSLNEKQLFSKVYRFEHWQLIMLDSSVSGSVHGKLDKKELALLEATISERPDLHTLVCLHHHPVDIGSAWLDKIGLHNRDDFFKILDKFDNVRGVLWGHIHQEWQSERNGVSLLATPSTCIQFLPKSSGFAVENIAPGYRWLSLHADGRIESKVYRAEEFKFDLDLKSTGY
jgi:Icc protein|tara:strand:+ start:1940 stop:2761 length:822 start_codon:yes stop_codon:yes gene_type:complete